MAGKGGKRSTSFKPGQSGNPKGRPKAMPAELVAAARSHTAEAIDVLVKWMRANDQGAVAVSAADKLLSRGWGLPKQVVEHQRGLSEMSEDELEELKRDIAAQIAADSGDRDSPQASVH